MREPGHLGLRLVTTDDLIRIEGVLRQPHVARWWFPRSPVEQELAAIGAMLPETGGAHEEVLTRSIGARPVGWWHWYRWSDSPAEALEQGAGRTTSASTTPSRMCRRWGTGSVPV